jgi:hypothetical protein
MILYRNEEQASRVVILCQDWLTVTFPGPRRFKDLSILHFPASNTGFNRAASAG